MSNAPYCAGIEAFKAITRQIGRANENMILACDAVLGVLDGAELGSGAVSEIGRIDGVIL